MRALFLRQLRHIAPMLGAMVLGACIFEIFIVWVSSSIQVGPEFQELLEMLLPPPMLKFVMSQVGFTSFDSTIAFGFKHALVLVIGIAFAIVAGSIPAAERETGLLDLILARPIRRERYLVAHMLLLLIGCILIPMGLLAGAAIGLALTGHLDDVAWYRYIAPAAAYVPLLFLIGAYTLFFAAAAQRRGIAVARAATLTIVFFWYEVLSTMWTRLEGYEWATIFYYYAPVHMLNGERGLRDPLLLLGLALLFLAGAFARFRRQQL